jgi:fumarate reductase subunit C
MDQYVKDIKNGWWVQRSRENLYLVLQISKVYPFDPSNFFAIQFYCKSLFLLFSLPDLKEERGIAGFHY